MNVRTGRTCASVAAAAGLAAMMQLAAHAQSTPPSSSSSQERTASEQQVTVTGCIQSEADYRKAHDQGKGGAVGTGVGVGNEFVLINASMGSGSAATGTTGTAKSTATAYELSGSKEGDAAQFVGKRVEIVGKLKAAEVSASGKPTGGATAGKPPEGVDVTSKDMKLREIDVTSIKEATGSCPAK
jgi:hypothetical protein